MVRFLSTLGNGGVNVSAMNKWVVHPIYKSAFGFYQKSEHGEVFRIVGHVERWDGWEERLRQIVECVNIANITPEKEPG